MHNLNDKHHFDFLWKKTILPILKRAIVEMDEDFKKQCNFDDIDYNKYKKGLEKIYKKKREWLKRTYTMWRNKLRKLVKL